MYLVRLLATGDQTTIWRWRQQPLNRSHLRHPTPQSVEEQLIWWKHAQHDPTRHDVAIMVPRLNSYGVMHDVVAFGAFTDIHPINRTAELAFLTDMTDHQRYSDDHVAMARTLVAYGSDTLNLRRLEAETYTGGREWLVQRLGFVLEGVKRQAIWRDGLYRDAKTWGRIYVSGTEMVREGL